MFEFPAPSMRLARPDSSPRHAAERGAQLVSSAFYLFLHVLWSQKCWRTEELHTRTASGGRRGDGERQRSGEALPPSTFPFAPPFFALAAKALLGHIGAGIVHGKTVKGAGSQWDRSNDDRC